MGNSQPILSYLLVLMLTWPMAAAADLQAEPIPNVVTLPVPYPSTYAMVHDFAFGSLIDSSFSLVDTQTRRLDRKSVV